MLYKWVVFSYPTFPLGRVRSSTIVDKQGRTLLTYPCTVSVALTQSLHLTFFPKTTFQLLFGKGLLKNMTKPWPPHNECLILDGELKEKLSAAKFPPLKHLTNIRLSTDNPKTCVWFIV